MRKRIQFFCISMRPGGTERIVARFANHLSKRNNVAITLVSRSSLFYRLRDNIRLYQPDIPKRQDAGWQWYPKTFGYMHRSISDFAPDVVLCFGENIAPAVLVATRMTGRKCIVFNRGSPIYILSGLRRLLYPTFDILSNSVVVQTEKAKAMIYRSLPLLKIRVLPNPIEIPKTSSEITQRDFQIVNVGTLGGRKGQADLINAFAGAGLKSKWKLVFVGDGPDRHKLEKLAYARGVADSVFFSGETGNVQEILNQSRIFAFPSRREGFPNALAEALAAGCACLSFDCLTGPSDLIEDEVNGLLVANGDQAAFEASLSRLAADQPLQERLSLAARDRIQEYSAEKIFARLDLLIEEALAV